MKNNQIIDLCRQYPDTEVQDIFKFIYQSCFGCEHLATDFDYSINRIKQESMMAERDNLPEIEMLDGDYCRLHLKVLGKGLSPETLCKMFLLSSGKQTDGEVRLRNELKDLIAMADSEKLPFDSALIRRESKAWESAGFPAVSHSERFRAAYNPAYRVIKKSFLRLLPLLTEIDTLLLHTGMQNLIVAIDGRCASGKTTMSSLLSEIYDCNVFHMDDFFLQPFQRTKERLSAAGENIDHERFLSEVLLPLSQNEVVTYQKFNCHNLKLETPVTVSRKRLNIIEGVYSLHPDLCDYYDLKVFSDISESMQKERITKRNSPEMAKNFFTVWIPLEENYFTLLKIREKIDITL